MRRSEGANEGVSQHHASHCVVGKSCLDELTERSLDHRRPKLLIDSGAQLRGAGEWSCQGRLHRRGQLLQSGLESRPCLVLAIITGQHPKRLMREAPFLTLDEKAP